MEDQFVVFELAHEYFGVEIALVEGIIKMPSITTVPHAPAFVEGVTNLRGQVLPVIDLHRRFGLPATELSKEARVVVVEVPGPMDTLTVGMVVDGVSEVLRISPEVVEPPAPIVTSVDSTFIKGIARVNERLVILLDLSQVLTRQDPARMPPAFTPMVVH